jgi:hypothetical protein
MPYADVNVALLSFQQVIWQLNVTRGIKARTKVLTTGCGDDEANFTVLAWFLNEVLVFFDKRKVCHKGMLRL